MRFTPLKHTFKRCSRFLSVSLQRRSAVSVFVVFLVLFSILGTRQLQADDFFENLFDEPQAVSKPSLQAEINLLVYETLFADARLDDPDEDFLDTDTRAKLAATVKGDSWKVHIGGVAQHTFSLGKEFISQASVEPWEVYAAWNSDSWDLSAGLQITSWGRGGFSLLDVVNPVDLSHGLSLPDEFIKKPIPQIKFDYYFDQLSIHAVYNPFFRESEIASTLSDWSPIRISQTEGLEDLPVFQQSVQQQIFPGVKEYPADDFLHSEIGARIEYGLPGWDFGGYFFTGYDRIVLPQFSNDFIAYVQQSNQTAVEILQDLQVQEVLFFNPLYTQKPERNFMIGGDLSTTLAGYTWRIEVMFQPEYSVFQDDLIFLRKPLLAGLLGVDSLSSSTFVLSMNIFAQWVMVKPSVSLLQTSALNVGALGVARWTPEWTKLSLELRAGGLVTDGSFFAQPMLMYTPANGHQLMAGVEIIEGPADRMSGAFSHNDNWILRYRYELSVD